MTHESSDPMFSPLKFYGGKLRLRSQLLKLFPPHRIYIELFGGSATMLFGKQPSHIEVVNDVNLDIFTFFTVLQNPQKRFRLEQRLAFTPFHVEEHRLVFVR